jgi:hypothetical protein
MSTEITIYINDNENTLVSELNKFDSIIGPIDLNIDLSGECEDEIIQKNVDEMMNLKLIDLLILNESNINSITIKNDTENDGLTWDMVRLIHIFLSFCPSGINNININLSNLELNDFNKDEMDNKLSYFFKKNNESCNKLKLSLNYLFNDSIIQLSKFSNLEFIELNLYSVGDNIGRGLQKIVRNNNNLNSLLFNLNSINNDDKDMPLWFLNLCEEICNHLNLKNIKITWKIDNIEEYDTFKDKNLIFELLLKKFYLNECKRIFLNMAPPKTSSLFDHGVSLFYEKRSINKEKLNIFSLKPSLFPSRVPVFDYKKYKSIENLNISILTPYRELNQLFENFFLNINTKYLKKRKYVKFLNNA